MTKPKKPHLPGSSAPQLSTSSSPRHPIPLTFLKLGGSLITDKSQPSTPKLDVIARLACEIAAAKDSDPQLRIVLGHGSGSFGHVPAKKYGTRTGVETSEEWFGFTQVWWQASALNRLVVEALQKVGLLALSFPVSAAAIGDAGQVAHWNIEPLTAALNSSLFPVVYGDVVFDNQKGGTIFSTEDIFGYLAKELNPSRILLAGLEEGVYSDYPERSKLIPNIAPDNFDQVSASVAGSASTDVTGGMTSKVQQMLTLVDENSNIDVCIFSGIAPGNVKKALLGRILGTHIKGNN